METIQRAADSLEQGCGPIGLLSGDEFGPAARPFDKALLGAARGTRVALLLSADPRAASHRAKLARDHFATLGATTTVVGALRRSDAVRGVLPPFDVLYLGGGSPADLLACLRDTPLWEEALERWRDGAALAGASAGAMALCEHSLEPEPGASVPERWTRGLGPVRGFALAVHASSRPRAWLDAVARTAPTPLVALDDATGVILAPGTRVRVAGSGRARVARAVET